jgi:hypothetical protein
MKAARKLRKLQQPGSLIDFIRQFLTPSVWKQARQSVPRRRQPPRWDLQPLVLIMMAMTWAAGDSQDEKFVTARGFYVACYHARKRPGTTLEGFQKALSRVPLRQFKALAEGVRWRIRAHFATQLLVDGFEPMGCDGSRIECCRSAELDARLGQAGNDDSAPTVWLTALVHLASGTLWSWRLGPGAAAEVVHLRHLLGTLSPQALIVCDAAYMGYDLVRAILNTRRSFLFRMSSKVHLYTLEKVALENWTEGTVLYWPGYVQKKGLAPITCRLIRIRATGRAKHDVWLLTDVLDPSRLSVATAAKFYRWRWRNEGLFRTYKRTINKLKLSSRTVRLVHREAELSLLATQILLAHAHLALRPAKTEAANAGDPVISPRKVLMAIRAEFKACEKRLRGSYCQRLQGCRAEVRQQKSPKACRDWPRRKPHEAPKPPLLHPLTDEQKLLLDQHQRVA